MLSRSQDSAIEQLINTDVDLVVTDMALHSKGLDMDGLRLLKEALKKDRNLPVILISSYLSHQVSKEVLDAGAFDILDRNTRTYDVRLMLQHKISLALNYRNALLTRIAS